MRHYYLGLLEPFLWFHSQRLHDHTVWISQHREPQYHKTNSSSWSQTCDLSFYLLEFQLNFVLLNLFLFHNQGLPGQKGYPGFPGEEGSSVSASSFFIFFYSFIWNWYICLLSSCMTVKSNVILGCRSQPTDSQTKQRCCDIKQFAGNDLQQFW